VLSIEIIKSARADIVEQVKIRAGKKAHARRGIRIAP
jgi:hypothetical protein